MWTVLVKGVAKIRVIKTEILAAVVFLYRPEDVRILVPGKVS